MKSAPLRVTTDALIELQRSSKIRNICILAHIDHGKTTLSDILIAGNGIISERQAGRMRYLDSMEDEQKRGITMRSSAISLLFQYQARAQTLANVVACDAPTTPYLINLVDSPGHIDFSRDVGTATRLCDGALILVDVVEGVCVQTTTVLRQAWAERLKPCLVLNKIDRLALELRLDPVEAWQRLRRTVEKINAICAAMISNQLKEDELLHNRDYDKVKDGVADLSISDAQHASLEAEWQFCPEKGNVVFASAMDGWGFQIADFARIWAKKFGTKPKLLRKFLWGNFACDLKSSKILKLRGDGLADQKSCMFASLILRPIWRVYEATHEVGDAMKIRHMAAKLGIEISDYEMKQHASDFRTLGRKIFCRWLPLARSVLTMAVDHMPSPIEAQAKRLSILCVDETKFSDLSPEGLSVLPASSPSPISPRSPESPSQCSKPSIEDLEENILSGSKSRPHTSMNKKAILLRKKAAQAMKEAIATCDKSENAPMIAFVSKMVAVPNKDLRNGSRRDSIFSGPADTSHAEDTGSILNRDEILVGVTRVFSGVLRESTYATESDDKMPPASMNRSPLFALGPKHDPSLLPLKPLDDGRTFSVSESSPHISAISSTSVENMDKPNSSIPSTTRFPPESSSEKLLEKPMIKLYMIMGDSFIPVRSVPAGNICAVAGLERHISKCATLVSPGCEYGENAVNKDDSCQEGQTSQTLTSESLISLRYSLDGGPSLIGPLCPAIRASGRHVRPMLRVAVEAARGVRDTAALEAGLCTLYQADPAVEVSVQQSGEQIIEALGELHLEQCLKDLRDKYARVPIRVSPPLLAFREGLEPRPEKARSDAPSSIADSFLKRDTFSVETRSEKLKQYDSSVQFYNRLPPQLDTVPWSTDEGAPFVLCSQEYVQEGGTKARSTQSRRSCVGRARVPAGDGTFALTVSCRSVTASLARILDEAPRDIVSSIPLHIPLNVESPNASINKNSRSRGMDFLLREKLAAFIEHDEILEAFGPRSAGPNILLRSRSEANAGNFLVRVHESVESLCHFVASDPYARRRLLCTQLDGNMHQKKDSDRQTLIQNLDQKNESEPYQVLTGEDAELAWLAVAQNIAGGFQLATAAGPMAEEPVYGVAFVVESIDIVAVNFSSISSGIIFPDQISIQKSSTFSPNVTKASRIAFRSALLSAPTIRLIEGFYKCDLQCDQSQLGNLYAVLSKRRGLVLCDELIEGTELFLVCALIPIAETTGFSSELISRTSGAATTPLLSFSHWSSIPTSPFWRPTTNDERDEFGEAYATHDVNRVGNIARRYIDGVRIRKGMMVEEKVVKVAEKQRTLTKNK